MKSTRLLPSAEAELLAAAEYYDLQRHGAGARLLNAVEEIVAEIENFPSIGPALGVRYRRLRVPGFPYVVIYQDRPDECLIVAVVHTSRAKGSWREFF